MGAKTFVAIFICQIYFRGTARDMGSKSFSTNLAKKGIFV